MSNPRGPDNFACALDLATQFLADPTRPIDGTCVEALAPPRFVGA